METNQTHTNPSSRQTSRVGSSVRKTLAAVLTGVALLFTGAIPAQATTSPGYGGRAEASITCDAYAHSMSLNLNVLGQYDASGRWLASQWIRVRLFTQTWIGDAYGNAVKGVGSWSAPSTVQATAWPYNTQARWRSTGKHAAAPAGQQTTFYVEVGWWNGSSYVTRGEWLKSYEQIGNPSGYYQSLGSFTRCTT